MYICSRYRYIRYPNNNHKFTFKGYEVLCSKVNVANCDSLIRWEKDFNPTIKFLDNKYKYKTYKIKNKGIEEAVNYKEKEVCNWKTYFKLYKFWRKNLIIL